MEIVERLLDERYRFRQDYIPYPLTQQQMGARKLFLEQIHKKGRYISVTECPYCGCDRFIKISETDKRGLPAETVVCDFCNGCFKSAVLDAAANKYHYENISYLLRGKEVAAQSIERYFWERVNLFAYPRYHFIRHFIKLDPKRDHIIEFGCNDGANLYPWFKEGFAVFGIELDTRMAEFGRKKGLNLKKGDLSEHDGFDRKPKLVILSHILEHISDIDTTLDKLSEILEPDGYIFIEVPGIRVQGLGDTLRYLDVEHNYYFGLNTLSKILVRHSFKIIYADEHIRLICTPYQNRPILVNMPISLSRDKAIARLIKVFIDSIGFEDKNLYDLLMKWKDNNLTIKIINRLQMLYFKFHYSSIVKNKAE